MSDPSVAKTGIRTRPGGRTARVTEQVLDATVELIAEQGAAAVTYDAVAKRAGTGRATLYRKWPQRDDLLRAALIRFAETAVVVPDSGDIRADVVEMLCMIADMLASPVGRAIINAQTTAGDDDPIRQLGREVQQARNSGLRRRIDDAVAARELPPLDADFLFTMLSGPVYVLVLRDRVEFTRELAERVVAAVFDGMVPRQG